VAKARARQAARAGLVARLPPMEREATGVAQVLRARLDALARNGDCRRCWLQRAHCVCAQCPPLAADTSAAGTPAAGPLAAGPFVNDTGEQRREHWLRGPRLRRLFVVMHHKEVGLAVDTAKLLLAAWPLEARLVVPGLGARHQPAMAELEKALQVPRGESRTLVLFPSPDARTFAEVLREVAPPRAGAHNPAPGFGVPGGDGEKGGDGEEDCGEEVDEGEGWDVVVVDGTWAQARKLHARLESAAAVPAASKHASEHAGQLAGQDTAPAGAQGVRGGVDGGAWKVQLSTQAVAALEAGALERRAAAVGAAADADAAVGSSEGSGSAAEEVAAGDIPGAAGSPDEEARAPGVDTFGAQLRRHPIPWREVSTLEAVRLLLRDMGLPPETWAPLEAYQRVADAAAKRQLGPPRKRPAATC